MKDFFKAATNLQTNFYIGSSYGCRGYWYVRKDLITRTNATFLLEKRGKNALDDINTLTKKGKRFLKFGKNNSTIVWDVTYHCYGDGNCQCPECDGCGQHSAHCTQLNMKTVAGAPSPPIIISCARAIFFGFNTVFANE